MDTIPEEKARKKNEELQEKVRMLILRKEQRGGSKSSGGGGSTSSHSQGGSRGPALSLTGRDGRRMVPHKLVNPISTMAGGHKPEHSGRDLKKHAALALGPGCVAACFDAE